MSELIGAPNVDPGDVVRPHYPLELAVDWTGTFTSPSGSDPIEQGGHVAINLKGGTAPSGENLGSPPAMVSLMTDSDFDDIPDLAFVQSCLITLFYAKHIIPVKFVWEATEVTTDEDGDTEHTSRGVIIMTAINPTPTKGFSPSSPSPTVSHVKSVAFIETYAPWLGKSQGDMNFQDEGNASLALV